MCTADRTVAYGLLTIRQYVNSVGTAVHCFISTTYLTNLNLCKL